MFKRLAELYEDFVRIVAIILHRKYRICVAPAATVIAVILPPLFYQPSCGLTVLMVRTQALT
jgi:hypothetical protein